MPLDFILTLSAVGLYTLLNLYLLRKVYRAESIIANSPTLKSEYANRKLREAQKLVSEVGEK